ncbi:NDP-hexose 2,3-dehydratase family protein [Streptomyces sp. SL54]|uniref:NDP-hexose 2,3-dehydratase family protein n=2 Tax=Streptantibioticus silvisoli TaxID=2705255 RepID=A0ABT6VWZ4_9ACTN|nr:NDP-hexose 2,3-dehydratase family protein [Streptantibioticus silvisoli]MDI5963014.1 NDP-hexose 2,3-dehydratase family protein [Streptantibioticus silvisoli]
MRKPGTYSSPHSATSSCLAASAAAGEGVMSDAEFHTWREERQTEQAQQVTQVPFEELNGWGFDSRTGNLTHRSGRFFSVGGIAVRSDFGPVSEWTQPIIHQPEIGVLGIAVKKIDGVLHLLMQAKSEPGNVNGVQLSPTVQATKSNYTRVHGGSAVPYIDLFRNPEPHSVVADVLQSEQGSWFLHKRNRNMVVEVGPEVEAAEDFCWLTLGQVNTLLSQDDMVNMDARTVLSCLPEWRDGGTEQPGAAHTGTEIRSWLTRRRAEHEVTVEPLGLSELKDWYQSGTTVSHRDGLFFDVIGADIRSHRREVPAWSQPLLRPCGLGVAALMVRRIDGVPHALFNARAEPGFLDVVELGPTVQCTPENYAHLPAEDQPRFLSQVLARRPEHTLFDSTLSEEGGRFQHARSRYLLIEAEDDADVPTGDDFRWLSARQVEELLRYGHQMNVQARTLVAAWRSL